MVASEGGIVAAEGGMIALEGGIVVSEQCSPRAHQLAAQTSPSPCTPSPAQDRPCKIHNQLAHGNHGNQPGP